MSLSISVQIHHVRIVIIMNLFSSNLNAFRCIIHMSYICMYHNSLDILPNFCKKTIIILLLPSIIIACICWSLLTSKSNPNLFRYLSYSWHSNCYHWSIMLSHDATADILRHTYYILVDCMKNGINIYSPPSINNSLV